MSMASDFLQNVGSNVSDLASALSKLSAPVDHEDKTRWTFDDGSTIEIRRLHAPAPASSPSTAAVAGASSRATFPAAV
ncbi:MAG: hypothetical protein QM617_12390 [Comamonas sp.]